MQEEIHELLKEIERMRGQLKRIAENEDHLTEPSVLAASQMLDAALNEYYKLVKDKF